MVRSREGRRFIGGFESLTIVCVHGDRGSDRHRVRPTLNIFAITVSRAPKRHLSPSATLEILRRTHHQAKARFSEVIDRALVDGPQTITRKGQKAVVVVSAEEWRRKTERKDNLAEFFAASPLRGSDLKIKRSKDGPREIEL
jgi:prevent-host-death family protein